MTIVGRDERLFLYIRDHFQCQYCGTVLPEGDLTLDHVIPKSRGGLNSHPNLVTACRPCNHRKGNLTPREARMPRLSKKKLAILRRQQHREETG